MHERVELYFDWNWKLIISHIFIVSTTICDSVPNDSPKINLKCCRELTLNISIKTLSTLSHFKPIFRIYTASKHQKNKFSDAFRRHRWKIGLKWVYLLFLFKTLNRSVCCPLQEVIGQNQTEYHRQSIELNIFDIYTLFYYISILLLAGDYIL